jgi:hypothetical protein
MKHPSNLCRSTLKKARVGGAVDDCYYLTKKECKLDPGCSYSKSGKSCSAVEDYMEVEGDECYELSKRQCKITPGCSYSKSGKACSPTETDHGGTQHGSEVEGDEDKDDVHVDDFEDEVEELALMIPPLPDTDPPEGWEEIESGGRFLETKSHHHTGKSGKVKFHKHDACACYKRFPRGTPFAGGFYCLCFDE